MEIQTQIRTAVLGLPFLLSTPLPSLAQEYRVVQLSDTVNIEQVVGSAASPFGRFGHDIASVGDTTGDDSDDVVFGLVNVPDPDQGYIYSSKPFLLTYDPGARKYTTDQEFSDAAPSRIFVRRGRISDLTGDGRGDVFLATTGGDGVWPLPECGEQNSVIINTPGGWVDASAQLPEAADYTHGMAGGDVNADGAEDILIVNSEYIGKKNCGEDHQFTNATYLVQFNANPADSASPRDVQSWLTTLGYDPGPIDGQPGRKTKAALAAFYADRQGAFDGAIDANEARDLYAALTAEPGQSTASTIRKLPLKAPQTYLDLDPSKGFEWENYSAYLKDIDGDGLPEMFLGSGDQTVILSAKTALDYQLAAAFDHPAPFAALIDDDVCQRAPSGRCASPVSDFIAMDVDGDGQDEVISSLTSSQWTGRYFQVFDLVDRSWTDVTDTVFPKQAPAVGQKGTWCWSLWAMDLTGDGATDLICANGSNLDQQLDGQIWIAGEAGFQDLNSANVPPTLRVAFNEAVKLPQLRNAETNNPGYQISLAGVARIEGKDTLLLLEKYWTPPDQAGFGEIRLYGLVKD